VFSLVCNLLVNMYYGKTPEETHDPLSESGHKAHLHDDDQLLHQVEDIQHGGDSLNV